MFIKSQQKSIYQVWRHSIVFLAMVLATICFWFYQRDLRIAWHNIPNVPSNNHVLIQYIGEKQLAYRTLSLKIQNFGDTGGQSVPLKSFDYQKLEQWLWLATEFDPVSNYIPNLAAYYFAGIDDPSRLQYIVDYLAAVGFDRSHEKWRWLAQAVFLSRFKLEDQDLALKLAYELAAMEGDDLPIWTKKMPAFVLAKVGEEKAAMDIITTIMATDRTLKVNEINYMCWYLEEKLAIAPDILSQNNIYMSFCS